MFTSVDPRVVHAPCRGKPEAIPVSYRANDRASAHDVTTPLTSFGDIE
jgi:hypothetical protein